MTRFDFAPLYRSTVGFDRLVQLLDAASAQTADTAYPPYNIERLDETSYRITMAVAGFASADLKIDVKENTLSVRAEKQPDTAPRQYLHRGIGQRSFERRFELEDYVEVTGANLADGVLQIDLVRNLPERMKPRTVTIGTTPANGQVSVKQLDAPQAS